MQIANSGVGGGCGFCVGELRGGGLGTVAAAAGWWRATGAGAAAARPVIEPPGAPTGARLLCSSSLRSVWSRHVWKRCTHTPHLPNAQTRLQKSLQLSDFNRAACAQTTIQSFTIFNQNVQPQYVILSSLGTVLGNIALVTVFLDTLIL